MATGRFSRLSKDIKSCAHRLEKADPETEATLKDCGTLPVEEGGHGYGLHTMISWGVFDTRLATSGMHRKTFKKTAVTGRGQAPPTA